jgi:hypothetical protein
MQEYIETNIKSNFFSGVRYIVKVISNDNISVNYELENQVYEVANLFIITICCIKYNWKEMPLLKPDLISSKLKS